MWSKYPYGDEDDDSKTARENRAVLVPERLKSLAETRRVRSSVRDGLVQIHISVTNLDVESAIWIAAYPGLIVYGSALTSKVG